MSCLRFKSSRPLGRKVFSTCQVYTEIYKFPNCLFLCKLFFSKNFQKKSNYAFTSNIREAMKFHKLYETSSETDFQ